MKVLVISMFLGAFAVYVVGEFAASVDKLTSKYEESLKSRELNYRRVR